jgi:3-deoxy-manno-octulosonate cytidylyltransferase (CMP-KDO synthetase)
LKVAAIIPARFGSSRLPGKPLALIGGVPMVVRVWQAAVGSGVFDEVLVATDHPDIAAVVLDAGGRVAMTRDDHLTGTDRCAEAATLIAGGQGDPESEMAIVNIQGDEPFIDPAHLAALADALKGEGPPIATLCRAPRPGELAAPQRVVALPEKGAGKIVLARNFTRATNPDPGAKIHIGLYGFRTGVLPELALLEATEGEKRERLEQLRWLENGYGIQLIEVQSPLEPPAVDTKEDLDVAQKWWDKMHGTMS